MIAPDFAQAMWRKSSYTTSDSNCVEFAAWQTSSYTTDQSNCVEVATSLVEIGIRDTKDRAGGHLTVSRTAWTAFLSSAR
ncbi:MULTISPECIES: DUF397 domain-containing protein [unclassified Amycolatopsis]|uniref:DUF397 domain-containing protein n=1 Tax=unclassified Amycolatopsis TaxID=2618356 RepID=UPI001C6A88BE|nr:DUF397 domain-containing protein [Amycolatopsis sp. DSM 110486]QYN25038.1 DUF397 domain-containing protein [Amycolatopsis sp. DSM 110486]